MSSCQRNILIWKLCFKAIDIAIDQCDNTKSHCAGTQFLFPDPYCLGSWCYVNVF